MGTILIVILILMLVGALPTWGGDTVVVGGAAPAVSWVWR